MMIWISQFPNLGKPDDKGSFDHVPLMEQLQVSKAAHIIYDITIQCLRPTANIDEKLEKDVKSQREAVEKQVKTMVNNLQKAKAKAVKKSRRAKEKDGEDDDAVLGKQEKNLFDTLGVGIPASKEESVEVLKSLLQQEEKVNTLIQKAKDVIQKPTSIPLTRLQGEDDRSNKNRTKMMQQALEQAQKSMNGPEEEATEVQFGLKAACLKAERGGIAPKAKAWVWPGIRFILQNWQNSDSELSN